MINVFYLTFKKKIFYLMLKYKNIFTNFTKAPILIFYEKKKS